VHVPELDQVEPLPTIALEERSPHEQG
jgi:hypothetical protein